MRDATFMGRKQRYKANWRDWLGLIPIIIVLSIVAFVATKAMWFDGISTDNKALFWASLMTGLATMMLCAVGVVAAVIAWIQLSRFNDNERVKNTLSLVRDYTDIQHYYDDGSGTPRSMTIALAVPVVSETANNLKHYNALRSTVRSEAGDPKQIAEYSRRYNAVIICCNFFGGVQNLAERGLIDKTLFFDFFSTMLDDVHQAISAIGGVESSISESVNDVGILSREARRLSRQQPNERAKAS